MIKRILALLIVCVTALILFYLSRFWIFEWWGREGLFGIRELRPQGGLLGRWLRGTPLAPFELLIWACGSFYVFTLLERLLARFNKSD
jgi:hypothetical protein